MKDELIKLLKKETEVSDKTIDEIKEADIGDFADTVKEIGKMETEYIKASLI